MKKNDISINIISSFNHANFVSLLKNSSDFNWKINDTDYNQVFQILTDSNAKIWKKKTNITLIVILTILSFSLIAAYIIEYGLGHPPCKLCVYQRIPYFFSIFLILSILLTKKYIRPSLFFLALISLCGSVLAFYHFGIEQGFFSESLVCEIQNQDYNLSKEELLKQLKEK